MKEILKGITNLTLKELGFPNQEVEEIANNRLDICNTCYLISDDKERCDKNKSINVGIKEVNGCGCVLKFKIRSDSKCPLNKW